MIVWFATVLLPVLALSGVAVTTSEIPFAETLSPPTPQRITLIVSAAQRDGWAPHTAALRAAALSAYEKEKPLAAEVWLNVYRWASLWGQSEADYTPKWLDAIQTARVGHSNMERHYDLRARLLGSHLSPALQSWLLGNPTFSAEFFALLSPVDHLPRVFQILNELHQRDPVHFKSHRSLALAIALVYDVPPPPTWPHGQVSSEALPRAFPPPTAAFAWWCKQEQLGRTYHRLSRLGAEELKFVVDVAAPFAELEWAQNACNLPLGQMARAYSMVRYRTDRVTGNRPNWAGTTYTLKEILSVGGICSDQAYFATQAGKARGVPTILIYGAGNDGRHAWFGFLDGSQKWQLDAGRYAEQRFVTGYARDPQTWREFSDHELRFVSERFRELPAFKQSRVHHAFAEVYLAQGRGPAAGAAARKAVNFERRNQPAWETLMAAAKQEGRDAKTIENLLREAALAFRQYPDLEAHYANRVADSLRARGETAAAEVEVKRVALKNRGERGDLSVQQARDTVRRAIETRSLPEQIRTYNTVVDTYGRGAGIGFFDEIVAGFAEHLVQLNQKAEAMRAVDRARRTLKVEPNSQLASEFERLTVAVRAAK